MRILVRSADKLAIALFAFGITAFANVPAIHIWFDEAMGVAEIANCVQHVGLLGTFFFVAALRDVGVPGEAELPSKPPVWQRRSRRPGLYWGVATAAVVATVALWAASDLPREAPDFTAAYGDQWTVAGYWAIGIGFVGWGLVELARTTLRVARYSNRAEVRVGLRVATVGVVAVLAYSATKIVQLARAPAGVGGHGGGDRRCGGPRADGTGHDHDRGRSHDAADRPRRPNRRRRPRRAAGHGADAAVGGVDRAGGARFAGCHPGRPRR